jgi:hypothetical protein
MKSEPHKRVGNRSYSHLDSDLNGSPSIFLVSNLGYDDIVNQYFYNATATQSHLLNPDTPNAIN